MPAQFSPQQLAVINHVSETKGHTIVSARAGTGKTTTMIRGVCSALQGNIAFVAYGKAIATEAEQKIKELGLDRYVRAGTCHSIGYGMFRRKFNNRVDNKKLNKIAYDEFTGEYETWRDFVIEACDMAKQIGIGILVPIDNHDAWLNMIEKFNLQDLLPEDVEIDRGINAAIHLLKTSNSVTNIVDFSDMIYLPLLFNLKVWQYDYVIVDECQDINPVRRELVRRMLKPNGKLIAVGDPHQAIFAFTGADHDSIDKIEEQFKADILPLSVSFRCPKAIIKVAQQWVPDIEAHESAPEGIVDSCNLGEIAKLAQPQDVVICRITKPLIELAYNLIRNGVACRVEGRAIGEGLIRLAQRWKKVKNVGQLYVKLEEWQKMETDKAKKSKNDSRCQVIEDQAETLRVFMDQCDSDDSIATLVSKIAVLFSDSKAGDVQRVLTLSTIHKTKGREWDRVFALGMDTYSPSKWARQDWEMVQEDNLCYVQVTRAKNHLTMVKMPTKIKEA